MQDDLLEVIALALYNSGMLTYKEMAKAALEVINTRAGQKNEDGLLPCPFCGSDAKKYLIEESDHTRAWISCSALGCAAKTSEWNETDDAKERWNTRATPPAPEWLDIKDAPQDWSNMILYQEDSGFNDDVFEGYYSCDDGGDDCWKTRDGITVYPTHYQPLPQPPKIGK